MQSSRKTQIDTVELKQYTLSELGAFISSGDYLNDPVVPITPQRVYSQQKNPKATGSDVVLTIAYSANGHILGYIGALPDVVDGVRCAWNSCWWVKQGSSADVSMKLFVAFLKNWESKVLFSEMTPLTASIIQRLGFCSHKAVIGFKGYYRFSLAEVLPRKKSVFKNIKGMLATVDALLNVLLRFRNFISHKKVYTSEIIIEETYVLSSVDEEFIQTLNINQPTKRRADDFNWIGQNSWLIARHKANKQISKGYYFSYAVSRFETYWVRFIKNGSLVALVNFTLKNSELKLPYVFCLPEAENTVIEYAFGMLRRDRALATITVFHQGIAGKLNKRKGFLFKTSLPKYSAISNELLQQTNLSIFEFQMGDGDCVFT